MSRSTWNGEKMKEYDIFLWDRVDCSYCGKCTYYHPGGEKKKIKTITASSYNNALYRIREWAKENGINPKRITVKKVYKNE